VNPPFVSRVVLKNYKSIAACDVQLGHLVFLVGPNGSGKSNFVDALRFVADALRTSLDHAMRERGGIKEVRRRSTGHPTHFGIRLEFNLHSGESGHYAFRIGARPHGGYEGQNEECVFREKLVWLALPLEAINADGRHDKSMNRVHPEALHSWRAGRPLAACRAVLFASIMDAPSSRPDLFPAEEEQEPPLVCPSHDWRTLFASAPGPA